MAGLWGLWAPVPEANGFATEHGDLVIVYDGDPQSPAVLVVFSVFQDRDTSLPLARALHRAGFTTLTYQLQPGRAFSSYLDSLRDGVDRYAPNVPIYAVGHSMGADLVATLASEDKRVKRLAALGFPVDGRLLSCPLLVAAGAWDQVHSRKELGAKAFLSPWCDHSQEPLDPVLARACVEHFQGTYVPLGRPNRVLARGLFVLGLFMLSVGLPTPRFPRAAGLAVLAVWAASAVWQDATLAVALVLILARANAGCRETSLAWIRPFAVVCISVGSSWLIYRADNWWHQPSLLVGLPVAVLASVPLLTARLSAMPLLVGLLSVIELVKPGSLFGLAAATVQAIKKRPVGVSREFDKRAAALLAGLIVIALVLWARVGAAGYLPTPAQAARLLWMFTVLLGLPLGLIVMFLRRDSLTV